MHKKIAGIVLAGGQSSRMGTNKALLPYRGRPLVEYMQDLLRRSGCSDIYISGAVPGYEALPDAVRHDGPARAMAGLLRRFHGRYDGLLFIPVDMPLMKEDALRNLSGPGASAYYESHPLPAFLLTDQEEWDVFSVKDLLKARAARPLSLLREWEEGMANINTKEEWDAVAV